ncbi:hypothetical protein NBRC3293_1288 [Gluconobacter oxydans NBRC 3293]|uniref:Uncharacterized protein n=1 Tax=Gluconobacter oxydans NBRC 3293 TaxID=1315969 RepID=A0A829WVP2_GLUOY|nr:hypothetical protein NBRC3293_1288 [Gluconobacter oxydans NBRC 3293]
MKKLGGRPFRPVIARSFVFMHPFDAADQSTWIPFFSLRLEAVPIDKNDPTQHSAVINASFAVALGKKRPQTVHLFVSQNRSLIASLLIEEELDFRNQINGS